MINGVERKKQKKNVYKTVILVSCGIIVVQVGDATMFQHGN